MKYNGTAGILEERLKSERLTADGAFGTYYEKSMIQEVFLSLLIRRHLTECWQFIKNILKLVQRL